MEKPSEKSWPRYKKIYEWAKTLSLPENKGLNNEQSLIHQKEGQIKQLEDEIEYLKKYMQLVCNHPLDSLYHSGFACATSGKNGGWVYSTSVHCSLCKKRWNNAEIPVDEDWY